MDTNERIAELQEKMNEFILNESVFADDHPSWQELADAQSIAESKWDETNEGKELKDLLEYERQAMLYRKTLQQEQLRKAYLDDEQDDYGYAEQKNFD